MIFKIKDLKNEDDDFHFSSCFIVEIENNNFFFFFLKRMFNVICSLTLCYMITKIFNHWFFVTKFIKMDGI